MAQLLHLESSDPDKDISLYINSPGGSIYAGLAIYDTMELIKPDVQTICFGIAMSMGSLLLRAALQGKRLALPNRRILIHQPSVRLRGPGHDIEIHAREVSNCASGSTSIYAQPDRQDREQVNRTWSATASSRVSRRTNTA